MVGETLTSTGCCFLHLLGSYQWAWPYDTPSPSPDHAPGQTTKVLEMQPHGTGQCQCTRFPSNGVQVALGKIQLLPGIAKLPRGIASVRRLWAQRIETVGGKLMLIFTSNRRHTDALA